MVRAMNLTPLRTSKDFRVLFWAGGVTYVGAMMTYVAVPFQLYDLTGSNLAVGAMGLVELVPLVVFGLWGGALADHYDRRKLLVLTGAAQVVLTAALLVNAALPAPASGRSTSWAACSPRRRRCSDRAGRR